MMTNLFKSLVFSSPLLFPRIFSPIPSSLTPVCLLAGDTLKCAILGGDLHQEGEGGVRHYVSGAQVWQPVPTESGKTADRPGSRDHQADTPVHEPSQT